jgi:CubicO group peptidase (beta-lactamase class C family)
MVFYKIPGVGIAVIDEYELDWAKGYGVLKAGDPAAVTTESLFEAASTTKLLVAATALHLVERGLLDLDADVNAYLKSWKIADNDFTQEQKVTLRLLLTHQSGLPMTNMAHDESAEPPTLIQVLNGELPAMNSPAAVEFVPGMKWQYSNIGYVVIQRLLEDTAGKPLAQIMLETTFEPLGMQSSTLEYPLSVELQTKEIMPHDAEGQAHEPAMHPTALAQGGLMTTPSNLARFAIELMRAYQGESNLVVSQETVRKMFRPELDLDPNILGMPISVGLGVLLRGTGQELAFLHPGDNWPGASCWLVGFPEQGKGAVIMTNGAKGNLLAMEVIAAIAKEYGWPADQ